jgi:hypothetical protein
VDDSPSSSGTRGQGGAPQRAKGCAPQRGHAPSRDRGARRCPRSRHHHHEQGICIRGSRRARRGIEFLVAWQRADVHRSPEKDERLGLHSMPPPPLLGSRSEQIRPPPTSPARPPREAPFSVVAPDSDRFAAPPLARFSPRPPTSLLPVAACFSVRERRGTREERLWKLHLGFPRG